MKPFLSCLHPVSVHTSKGNVLVRCNSCVMCHNNKRNELSELCQLECQQHKYVEMINLTYSESFIPYVDFNRPLSNVRVGNPFALHFGKRVKERFHN